MKNKTARAKASIIGVGMTRFGNVLETPEIKDASFHDLITEAVFEAMDDAKVEPKDIDLFISCHYQVPTTHVNTSYRVMDWIGMQFKNGFHYTTACSSMNSAAHIATMAIMSGIADIVLVAGAEILNSEPTFDPTKRNPLSPIDVWAITDYGADQEYYYQHWYSLAAAYGAFPLIAYAKKYGLSMDKLDEALCAITTHLRKCSSLNPKANLQKTLEDEARERGFKDVMEYWESKYNPYLAYPLRVLNALSIADGAAAYIVCKPEKAKEFTDTPIDILGFDGRIFSVKDWYSENPLYWQATAMSFKNAYKNAGIEPKDIDYLHIHDCMHSEYFVTAELSGYFNKGEAWKAYIEGRIGMDGDKPLNCSGGRHGVGHAFAASPGADLYDIVKQMRGEAGRRQIKKEIETAVWHNHGYGLHSSVTVLSRR